MGVQDCNSLLASKTCPRLGGDAHCIPGCFPPGRQCPDIGQDWQCSYPPTQLKAALQAQQSRASYRNRNNEASAARARPRRTRVPLCVRKTLIGGWLQLRLVTPLRGMPPQL